LLVNLYIGASFAYFILIGSGCACFSAPGKYFSKGDVLGLISAPPVSKYLFKSCSSIPPNALPTTEVNPFLKFTKPLIKSWSVFPRDVPNSFFNLSNSGVVTAAPDLSFNVMLVSVCTNCLTSLPCDPTNISGKKAPLPNPGTLPVFDNNSFTLFSANPNELKLPAVLDFSTASLTSFNLSDSLEVIVGGLANTRFSPY
jgi:hypothetical protein